jgi:hypothetical protein
MADYLRLDYSAECEECGVVEDLPASLSEQQAQKLLHDKGWRLIDDSNHCLLCVAGDREENDG